MKIQLNGKHALVCGSTQGIGKAIALEFAALGASVTLIARNESALQSVLRELPAGSSQQHGFVQADFTQPDALRQKIAAYLADHSPVHILVNNTGGPAGGPLLDADSAAFANAFSQHLICNQLLAQAVVPGMKSAGYGRIINIISTSVKQPIPGLGVSNTIRGAVANWAKTLAGELASFGITVNNILPGATKTQRLFSLFDAHAAQQGKTAKEIAESWRQAIPAKRFAEPAELAFAAAFLASPAAGYINGINLPVDGGRTNCL